MNHLTYDQVFKAFLINDYERKPGAAKISKSTYRILRVFRHESWVLTKENWREAVVPSSNLVVSILVPGTEADPSLQCPLCKRKFENTPMSL